MLLNPPGTDDFESTFLEIVIPNKKNIIVDCKRHYLHHILLLSAENINCALVDDFNINLLKSDTCDDILTLIPKYSLIKFQPTRPI